MNDVERNAWLSNLDHKITGTNSENLTGRIHANPLIHVMGIYQCRKITQHSHWCIKTTANTINIISCASSPVFLQSEWSPMTESLYNHFPLLGSSGWYISSGSGTLWTPTPCHIESYQPNAFGMTPMFDSLQNWGLSLLFVLVSRRQEPTPHSLKTLSGMCTQSRFCGFDKGSRVPVQNDLHEINASTDF